MRLNLYLSRISPCRTGGAELVHAASYSCPHQAFACGMFPRACCSVLTQLPAPALHPLARMPSSKVWLRQVPVCYLFRASRYSRTSTLYPQGDIAISGLPTLLISRSLVNRSAHVDAHIEDVSLPPRPRGAVALWSACDFELVCSYSSARSVP